MNIINILLPNVSKRFDVFAQSLLDTLIMVLWSGSISFVLGLFFGIILTVTKKNAILENKFVFEILDKTTNFFRSIPFIILLTGVMPLTRLIMGSAIGIKGAIVPLIFGCTPFFTRQVESALSEVDGGLIEAAESMGLSPIEIIFRVYLKESVGAIARATTITIISLIGLTAMAGAVGAGGIGDFAIRYGHDRNQLDATWITIIVLVILVSIIQGVGAAVEKKNKK